MANRRAIIPLLLALIPGGLGAAATTPATENAGLPPDGPRDFSSFARLVSRSPFMMPSSGGEHSPLAQRYNLTGAAKINDKPHVFILDVQSQARLMLAPGQPEGEVELVSFEENADPSKVRAIIRVGTETASLSFGEARLAPPPAAANPAEGDASPAQTSASPSPTPVPASNPAPAQAAAGQLPRPTDAELQAAGIPPGTPLQPAPPRRTVQRKTKIPMPTNAP